MLVDLIQVTTRDGVRLDGMFQQSSVAKDDVTCNTDAVCFIHGTGGNFYSSTLVDFLGERLLQKGCSILRINTRGHDGISTAVTSRGGKRLGAAYEIVDDCRHDIAAWCEYLRGRGCEKIVLAGHSLGAVKSIYALAHDPDLPVRGLIAISPPRLSYSWFCQSEHGDEFLDTFNMAHALAGDGTPETLIEVRLPLPFVITAAGYVEKYGPEERYNFLEYISSVPCPTLVTFGSVELANNMAFRGSPDPLQALSKKPKDLTVQTIEGGDHFYAEARPNLADAVETWLSTSLP